MLEICEGCILLAVSYVPGELTKIPDKFVYIYSAVGILTSRAIDSLGTASCLTSPSSRGSSKIELNCELANRDGATMQASFYYFFLGRAKSTGKC